LNPLTTASGIPVADNQNSLTADARLHAAAGLPPHRKAAALQPRADERSPAMNHALDRLDAARRRSIAGWTIFTAGALHGLAQALPLLTRGL
jgi:hypothetical protein